MNPTELTISMIVAMAHDRVIGVAGGGIPWKLPRDSAHFRNYTAGKFMLLGRTTYEEMEGWFTTQTPIVLTGRDEYEVENGFAVDSVAEAIRLAAKHRMSELVVSGGASVYEAALPFADELVLTLVDAAIEGDRVFPDYKAVADWQRITEEHFEADAENEYPMTLLTLRRRL